MKPRTQIPSWLQVYAATICIVADSVYAEHFSFLSQQCVYARCWFCLPWWFCPFLLQLKVFDSAPHFSAIDDTGKSLSLTDYLGKVDIVLYFYPKDFTLGCTKEGCTFRDRWNEIRDLGAIVLGVSSDDEESHREFKSKHALPFTLLSDSDKKIRSLYGVKGGGFFSLLPPRVTFVIDKKGRIRDIFNSQLNVTGHVENAIEVLKKIKSEEQTESRKMLLVEEFMRSKIPCLNDDNSFLARPLSQIKVQQPMPAARAGPSSNTEWT